MATRYAMGGVKGAAVGAAIGSLLGLWNVYSDQQRRRTKHLGLPELVYLDQYDDVVYALAFIQQGSAGGAPPVDITNIAIALNDVASLAVRVETEEYPGHLQFQLARKAGLVQQLLGDIVARKGRVVDVSFDEHVNSIAQFIDDTEHNNLMR
jgi:hypothetical protein